LFDHLYLLQVDWDDNPNKHNKISSSSSQLDVSTTSMDEPIKANLLNSSTNDSIVSMEL
jgi:hypothetical protein